MIYKLTCSRNDIAEQIPELVLDNNHSLSPRSAILMS
jgi:hypothetical protein